MAEISKLGRYELRRILGRGAMGVVYEGFDPNLSRRVAVKTIRKSVALDPETERAYAARFTQEAKAVARLNHPNIVQVYDFGVEDEVAYLVMEFVEGRELRSFFEAKEKFAPEEVVRIMGELLDALDFAHEAGVIHRDVKPANVMMDSQRRAKLADFGVARIQDSAQRSTADTMVGTPAYMSPEQISGAKVDRRTDIFSAGTILYLLLTGEQPFKGEGAWTVAKAIMQDNPPRPSSVALSLSSAFDAVVNKALAKNPAERFASAKEFSSALRKALAASPQAAASAGTRQKTKSETKASDTDLEFWRSIQNRDDLEELELYVEQFPNGAYAQLARLKIAKLREPAEAEASERLAAEAETKARQEEAATRATVAVDADATVAIGGGKPAAAPSEPPPARKKPLGIPAVAALAAIAASIAAYFLFGRSPAPPPVADAPTVLKAPAVDVEQIRRETEERLRREFAEKAAAEKAATEQALAEKAAAEKAAQESALAEEHAAQEKAAEAKKAAQKAQAEKIATDRAAKAAENLAKERAASEMARLETLKAERAAAERAAAEKADAERLAAEKAAAERVAAEKAAAEKARQTKRAAIASSQGRQGRLPPCPVSPGAGIWTNCSGEATLPGGEKYAGDFRDGTYGGHGSMTFPNGARYVGEFRGGTYNGQGAFTLPNGERYVGEFRDGKSSGQGTYTFPNGEKYVGGFRDGVYSGSGTYMLPSGEKWVGEWRNGKRNGQGIEYRADGTVLRSGIWADGKFARALASKP